MLLSRRNLFVLLATGSLLAVAAQCNAGTLRAGAAAVDISPTEFPLNMPGGFRANMGQTVHDPFFARAIVLDDGATKLAMVVVDSLGVPADVVTEAKKIAAERTPISTDHMMVSSTHTHTGPPYNGD